jgi:hypothetical protein
MLIMALLVLSIGFLQNILDLLVDVLNPLNEFGGFFDRRLIRGRVCLCGGKRKCNINGSQGLESQTHLKWAMAGGTMESLIVTVLDIWETLIPCMWMLRIVHVQYVHNHRLMTSVWPLVWGWKAVDFVSLVSNRDQRLDQKVLRNLLSRSKMMVCGIPKWTHTHSKKILAVSIHCEILLIGYEDGHLQKPIHDHEHTVISLLGGWKS